MCGLAVYAGPIIKCKTNILHAHTCREGRRLSLRKLSSSLYWRHYIIRSEVYTKFEGGRGPGAIFCLREGGFSCEVGGQSGHKWWESVRLRSDRRRILHPAHPSQQLFQPFFLFDFGGPQASTPPQSRFGFQSTVETVRFDNNGNFILG